MRYLGLVVLIALGALYLQIERAGHASNHAAEVLIGAILLVAAQAYVLLRD
jgi:hypothetical protein